MFLFDATNRASFDDFRSAVHDSDGLLIQQANGETLWRPLANPSVLQVSSFGQLRPVGFGLLQRHQAFEQFQDAEARYDKRPSLWIEPQGVWGEGEVVLVEIPSSRETNDNIVAYWQPTRGPQRRQKSLLCLPDELGRGAIQRATAGSHPGNRRWHASIRSRR
jgi:glucans biosynthesis protein